MEVRGLNEYWYPVLLSERLPANRPVACELLGRPLVLFREAGGSPVCLEDRCPHRSVPLSGGSLRGGALECPYHGWQFGAGGNCLRIPSLSVGADLPAASRATALPCQERHGMVWVWAGTPGGQPEDLPCERLFAEQGSPGWSTLGFTRDIEIPHELMIENLLDPAHLPFTHEGTLARRTDAQALEVVVEDCGETLLGITRWPASPGRAEQRFTFQPPCAVRLDLKAGAGKMVQLHFCVPLDRRRMRMNFWFFTDFMTWTSHVPGAAWLMGRYNERIVGQDLEMLAGQARQLDRGARPWGASVPADRMAIGYRKWFQRASGVGGWFPGFG